MVSVVLLAMYLGVLLSSLSMCLRPLGLEVLPVPPLRVGRMYFWAPSLVPPGYRVLDFMTKDFPLPVNDLQRSFFFWSHVSPPEGFESFLSLLVL